jgi:spermidine synthase
VHNVRKRLIGLTLLLALTLVGLSWAQASRVLFQRESAYNHVVVVQEGTERVLHFRRQRFDYRETSMDMAQPLRLLAEHTRLMMTSLTVVPQPRRVLMIGLGGGIVSRVMSHYLPNCVFDNVELDPVVVDAARRFFNFREGPRMRVHVRDGRVFLRRSRDQYDMIILDAYRGGYIPFHLKTREFLELVSAHLAPQGVVVANLHFGTELYESDLATYAAVFPQVYTFRGQEDANVILLAQKQGPRLSQEDLRRRAQRLQQQHQFTFDLPRQVQFYRSEARRQHRGRVLTDDHAPVEALNER